MISGFSLQSYFFKAFSDKRNCAELLAPEHAEKRNHCKVHSRTDSNCTERCRAPHKDTKQLFRAECAHAHNSGRDKRLNKISHGIELNLKVFAQNGEAHEECNRLADNAADRGAVDID